MALEHALLVALSERPGSGLELTRRFERSIGFFWHATHQQIYRVLRADGGRRLGRRRGGRAGRPARQARPHAVADRARRCSPTWLGRRRCRWRPSAASWRSSCAGRRTATARGCSEHLVDLRADHATRLAHYEQFEREQFPEPADLDGAALDQWLVLRGGIRLEQFWIDWITEYLDAHEGFEARSARTSTTERD